MEPLHHESRNTELLATVAHELRNPLAAIQCAVRVLEAPNQSDATLQQARAVISRQVTRIVRISDDLLSAGYIATGELELCKQRVDLHDVVQSAVEACRPQLDAGHHTLMLHLPAAPVEVIVDPIRITQVLTNLLDNAAKYSDPFGSIIVRVEGTRCAVTISVVDRGIGIAPEFLPRVFDLFARSDQSKIRPRAGMGIGLNLVKRLVELHHGTVEACSAGLGMGSTFTVWLPRST